MDLLTVAITALHGSMYKSLDPLQRCKDLRGRVAPAEFCGVRKRDTPLALEKTLTVFRQERLGNEVDMVHDSMYNI